MSAALEPMAFRRSLWYRNTIPQGTEFVLVDASTATRRRAFDHAALAAALSAAADTSYDEFHLPFTQFVFSSDGRSVVFELGSRRFTCGVDGDSCSTDERIRDRDASLGGRKCCEAAAG